MQNKIFNRFLLPLLISICISTSTHAQSFNQQEQIVQQPIIKLFDALSNSDAAGLRLYTTRDVKFYEYGQVWPIDTHKEIVKWMETVILIKEKKQWKINTLHSTRLISN